MMPNPGTAFRKQLDLLAFLACAILLSPAIVCRGQETVDKPNIDIDDYFQFPADMVNNFPLIHNVAKTQESTAFAQISKDGNSWTTHETRRSVTIPTASTNLSFVYHNRETGTITKVQNTYRTVADTVYLEHLPSVLHVECDNNSTLTITYNTSFPISSQGMRFGLKRAHFLQYTKVAGGQSFFCKSSCAMGTIISRNADAVISYSEDPETGLLSSITIETSPAPQEMLYDTVADYFINGTFALVPKTRLRAHSNSSRLNWHSYLRKVHDMRETFKLRSAAAKLRGATCQEVDVLCYEIGAGAAEIRYKKTIDLFNFNYDNTKGKAVKPFIQLFGTGAPTTTETVGTGIVFGCDNCYAYAGVTFVFKVAITFSLSGLNLNYVQMQVSGKILGNFNLVAIVPTPSSGTRLLYQKSSDGTVKTMDGKSAFTNQLANFGTNSKFNTDSNIMPDFPADTKKLFTLTLGSITLNAYMALAIEVAVTGDNVFTAQAGAYASATMKVGLFVFQKISATCDVGTFDNGAYNKAECIAVADAAGTNPTDIGTCTPPTSTSTLSGKCIGSKYLVIQLVDGPTLKSGLNGPSLKADKKVDLTVTVSIYPIAKITAYDGIFSLYASPKLKAVITGKTAQTGCSDGVQIQAPVFSVEQVYVWSDIMFDIAKWVSACTSASCKFGMGVQAPLLLTAPISIPLPAFVTNLFPLCAAVASSTPTIGRLVAATGSPSSLSLGSSVSVASGTAQSKAAASVFADSDVFPADSEVLASSGVSASPQGTAVKTTFTITAKKSDNSVITAVDSGKSFSFSADFSGKATLSTSSVHLPNKSPTVSSEHPQTRSVNVRAPVLLFCPKPIADCVTADWTVQTCSGTCSISGTVVTDTAATKLGSYALIGAVSADDVNGSPNKTPSSDSSAFTTSLVLYLAVTALAHLCF